MPEQEQIKQELNRQSPSIPFPVPETPYQVPEGYFSSLPKEILKKASANQKLVQQLPWWRFTRKNHFFIRLAAAACLTGAILGGSYLFTPQHNTDITKDPSEWVKQEIRKISDEKIDNFIELTATTFANSSESEEVTRKSQELALLIKDIPSEEIQSLLRDVSDGVSSNESSYK